MTMWKADGCDECPAAAYLRQGPENLVVNGYRNWIAGLVEKDRRYWDVAWQAHAEALGAVEGQIALDALSALIGQLGVCARCPLRFYKPGAGHLCRDECLMLGMIAGAQHGDENTLIAAAKMLSCSNACAEVIDHAGAYAAVLLGQNQRLAPIPFAALADIDFRAAPHGPGSSGSLH